MAETHATWYDGDFMQGRGIFSIVSYDGVTRLVTCRVPVRLVIHDL